MHLRTAHALFVVGAAVRSAKCGRTVEGVSGGHFASYALEPANSAPRWAASELVR